MITILLAECLALLMLILCSAFFSSAESALFSLNPVQIQRIRQRRPRCAERIADLLAQPTGLLSTILIGNTLVNVLAAGLGYSIASACFKHHSELIAIGAMTVVLLVFGEVAPKRAAMAWPERLSAAYAPVLAVLVRWLTPVRSLLEPISNIVEQERDEPVRALTEDEFRTVVEVGEEEGVLDEEERTMVDGIIRMEDSQASDIMTPRVDLVGIDLDDPPEDGERIAKSARYRYLPVFRKSLDEPEGFLDVPRFLMSESRDLRSAMIPPAFVPETIPLDTLLRRFRQEQRRVAFVTDEYGGTAGLITQGDILEEIVDDVDNEFGEDKLTIQQMGENRWLIDGGTSLEDVNYELDLNLEAEGADRIAGWVSAQAERIARTGDTVEAQGCRVTVQRARRTRVLLVLLEKDAEAPQEKEA